MRIFCELRSIFPSPAGARKNTSNEQNVRSYYMLNHRIRGLLFHCKKKCYFAIGFYFLSKSIQKQPDSVCQNDVNNEQTVRKYYAKPLNERLIILHKKNPVILASIFYFIFIRRFVQFSHSYSFCIRRYSPFCKPVKPGHYGVLRPCILRVLLTLYGKMT